MKGVLGVARSVSTLWLVWSVEGVSLEIRCDSSLESDRTGNSTIDL
jgi:hypothetical protein